MLHYQNAPIRNDKQYIPEVALWRAVLLCGIKDAVRRQSSMKSRESEIALHRRQAKLWIKSKDFEDVCDYAGFDPEYIRSNLDYMLAKALENMINRTNIGNTGLRYTHDR